MSLSHRTEIQRTSCELMEKVILGNDLAGLSSMEKVQYVKNICDSIGLNPVTKPIQLMKFQGKEIPYFTKDATEQLRKINRVSITAIENKMLDGGIYVVTAQAETPDGRKDSSTGAVCLAGLKGDAIVNAILKAETKAKRRVTLSICGLGFTDESEVETIPNAKKVDIEVITHEESLEPFYQKTLAEIESAINLEELKKVFMAVKMIDWKGSDYLKMLIEAKDKKKIELEHTDWVEKFDPETGEEKQ